MAGQTVKAQISQLFHMCRKSGTERPGQTVKAQISQFFHMFRRSRTDRPRQTVKAQIRQLFHMCRRSGTDSDGPDQTALSHVQEQWNRQAWAKQ